MLTADLDSSLLSELGAIGLAEELRRAARIGAIAASSERMPDLSDLVMIGGLPRTGTTFLHDLLAEAMPGRRTLRGWEAFDPTRSGDPRLAPGVIQEAQERFDAARHVAPRLHDLHRLDAYAIEECTPLLQNSLGCLHWAMMTPSPDYVEWLLSSRLEDAHRLWAAQLGLIDEFATSWLLKSPMHMVDYRSLFAAAPSVRLIHIRRSAPDVVRSFLNLCLEARRVFADSVEGIGPCLGGSWLHILVRIVGRAERDLDDLGTDVVIVDYADLIANPSSVVRAIGDRLEVDCASTRATTATRRSASWRQLPLEAFGLDPIRVIGALEPHLDGRFVAKA